MCEKEPKRRSCTECPQYDGAVCKATGIWLGGKELILHQEARRGFICLDTEEAELKEDAALKFAEVWAEDHDKIAKSVDDTMYHPNVVADSTDLHSATVCPHKEGNTFKMTIRLVDSDDSAAGSPSSECPSCKEGPPQKGKIDENNPSDATLILSGTIVAGEGIQVIENPGPLWKDTNGYWEPIKPRSCTNCKLYNDPICMKIATHIGTRAQIWQREDLDGFQCIAALPKEEREAVITSIGCNNRKETK